jgi:ribosome-associated protein
LDSSAGDIVVGLQGVRIPRSELRIRFVRSGGPGGQNVNKVATKAILEFSVARSGALDDAQKERITARLGRRVNSEGVLQLQSQRYRSQARNEADVLDRFRDLLREALRVRRRRVPTSPTRASRERRLDAKRRRSRTKDLRKPPDA